MLPQSKSFYSRGSTDFPHLSQIVFEPINKNWWDLKVAPPIAEIMLSIERLNPTSCMRSVVTSRLSHAVFKLFKVKNYLRFVFLILFAKKGTSHNGNSADIRKVYLEPNFLYVAVGISQSSATVPKLSGFKDLAGNGLLEVILGVFRDTSY